mmetsp:Transcript_62495/g.125190  ORF Transcript_62495/g.125190 Transcript_62495/m.125190 type:complete len:245 (-) Transcript_62495:3-737(-)
MTHRFWHRPCWWCPLHPSKKKAAQAESQTETLAVTATAATRPRRQTFTLAPTRANLLKAAQKKGAAKGQTKLMGGLQSQRPWPWEAAAVVAVVAVDKGRIRFLAKTQTPPPPPPALFPQSRLLTRLLPVLRGTTRKSPTPRRRQHRRRRRLRAREAATRERNLNLSCPRRCRQAVEGRLEESTWPAPLATITRKGTLVLVAAEVISMRGGKLSVVGFSMKGGKPSSRFNGFIGALPYEETLARR